jgi:hypothetical protein
MSVHIYWRFGATTLDLQVWRGQDRHSRLIHAIPSDSTSCKDEKPFQFRLIKLANSAALEKFVNFDCKPGMSK